ncbi:MAG: organic hydroperoxide resistance protein [Sphingomonadales bacterium]|nr:organic hydroperoxide resistance protein [Sphingomonadales bacterium]
MTTLYTTQATATGGRTGSVRTADGTLDVTLVTPRELGGPGGDGNNPEQLFAAGYSACFLSAMKYVAGQKKVALSPDSTVTATVGIGPRADGQGFGLDVALEIALPGIERAVAQEVMDQATRLPLCNATRNSLDVRLSLA